MTIATADLLGPIIMAYDQPHRAPPRMPCAATGSNLSRRVWPVSRPNCATDKRRSAFRSRPSKPSAKELGKAGRKRVDGFVPLARLLWDDYGREGRVVAAILLGQWS